MNDRTESRAESIFVEDLDLDGYEIDGAYIRESRPPPFPEQLMNSVP